MKIITGDEPAMPTTNSVNGGELNESGLNIRQQFAAMAMQGLLHQNLQVDRALNEKNGSQVHAVVEVAVKMADALIKELNKES